MPQHKSAAKRVRQNEKRRRRNHSQKAHVRTLIKDLEATTDKEKAQQQLRAIKARLDRMAGRRTLHPNKAANIKSRLDKYVSTLN